MEIDFIFLKKENAISESSLKELVVDLLGKTFIKIDGKTYYEDMDQQRQEVTYKLLEKNNNLYLKVSCTYSEMKSADILDGVRRALQKGQHKANLNTILIYDEVSQVYCCKLMYHFGIFERRLRELMYLTLIKAFGIKWYEASFSEAMKNNLSAKAHGQKEVLVEGALNELSYEELKVYLFEPYSTIESILENELAPNKLQRMSKEELVSYINMGRNQSIWDRFFSDIKGLENIQEQINYLQPNRNKVMHHKTLSKQEFLKLRKELKVINRKLEAAVVNAESKIYTEDDLKQVLSAISRTFIIGLGNAVKESVRPFLSALGQITVEAMRSKYEMKALMPAMISSEVYSSVGIEAKRWADSVVPSIQTIKTVNDFAMTPIMLQSKELVDNVNAIKPALIETIKPLYIDSSVIKNAQTQMQMIKDLSPLTNIVTGHKQSDQYMEGVVDPLADGEGRVGEDN